MGRPKRVDDGADGPVGDAVAGRPPAVRRDIGAVVLACDRGA